MSIKSWRSEFCSSDCLVWKGLSATNLHKHEVRVLNGILYGLIKSNGLYHQSHMTLFRDGFNGVLICGTRHNDEFVQSAYDIWHTTSDASSMIKLIHKRRQLRLLRVISFFKNLFH
jgi:hypothetical protein